MYDMLRLGHKKLQQLELLAYVLFSSFYHSCEQSTIKYWHIPRADKYGHIVNY